MRGITIDISKKEMSKRFKVHKGDDEVNMEGLTVNMVGNKANRMSS